MSSSRFRVNNVKIEELYEASRDWYDVRISVYFSHNNRQDAVYARFQSPVPIGALNTRGSDQRLMVGLLEKASKDVVSFLTKNISPGEVIEGLSDFYSPRQVRTVSPGIPTPGALAGYRGTLLRTSPPPERLIEEYEEYLHDRLAAIKKSNPDGASGRNAVDAILNDSGKGT